MTWLFFAMFARFVWAGSTAVDQLFSRAHRQETILSASILYFCMVFPIALFSLSISDWNYAVDASFIGWVVLSASVNVIAILPFYKCLQTEDAHNLVPFWELTPVFLMLLAFLFRGEVLAPLQLLGAAIVILCGFLFSWDFRHGHFRFRIFLLMGLSAFLYAVYQLSMRMAADTADIWGVCGSILLAESTMALCAFTIHKRARRSILSTAIETRGKTVAMAFLSSGLAFAGMAALVHAFQTAPTTGHVAALGPTQPFFSFFIAAFLGVVLARYYPRVAFDHDTKIKLFLLVGIFGGIYLLVMG